MSQTGILKPLTIGPGTRFRAKSKSMGRTVGMVIEITAYERPRRLASSTQLSAMDIRGTLNFDPVPQGTRMHWSWELEPRGVFKLMTPIVARKGQHQEATIWANLKHLLEEQQTTLRSVQPGP